MQHPMNYPVNAEIRAHYEELYVENPGEAIRWLWENLAQIQSTVKLQADLIAKLTSENNGRKWGLEPKCSLCGGDGYVEMGDRDTGSGAQAYAVTCVCHGGDLEDFV